MGEWITEEGVKEHILSGFKRLFTIELTYSTQSSDVEHFSCSVLSELEKEKLIEEVTIEEIKAGMRALKPFKAPKADGLHAGFFQRFWHEVQDFVCKEVGFTFQSGTVAEYLNETLIALIPKCQSPESLGNYRPVSLWNSVYKVITKIIIARLRPYLNNLVSPMQTAFVPSRRGMDNIVIA